MKKLVILMSLAALAAVNVYGQGTINALNATDGRVQFNGAAVDGTEGLSGQYYAGATAGSLAPIGEVRPVLAGGIVNGGVITVAGLTGAGFVQLQAWHDASGATGANTAVAHDFVTPPTPPARPSFGAGNEVNVVIPEPSTIALAVLGGAALLFVRRRK